MSRLDAKKGLGDGITTARLRTELSTVRKVKKENLMKRFRKNDSPASFEALTFDIATLMMSSIVDKIKSASISTGLRELRSLLDPLGNSSDEIILLQTVKELMPYIINGFQSFDYTTKDDALWCIANFATADHDQTNLVAQYIPFLQNLLISEGNLNEQVFWVLGNIAGDCDECRQLVYPSFNYMVHALVSYDIMVPVHSKYMITCAWAISNVMRGSTPVGLFMSTGRVREVMALLDINDRSVRSELAWIFVYVTAKEDSPLQELIDNALLQKAIVCVKDYDVLSQSSVPFIIIMSNLVEAIDFNNNELLSQFYLDTILKALCQTSDVLVVKETLMMMMRLSEYQESFMKQLRQIEALPASLFHYFLTSYFDLRKDSLVVIGKIFSGCRIPDKYLSDTLIERFVLGLKENDLVIQSESLAILRNISLSSYELMDRCNTFGLLDVLDEMQFKAEHNISSLMRSLCEEIYAKMEEMDELNNDVSYSNEIVENVSDIITNTRNTYDFRPQPMGSNTFSFSTPDDSTNSSEGQQHMTRGFGRGRHLAVPSWMKEN